MEMSTTPSNTVNPADAVVRLSSKKQNSSSSTCSFLTNIVLLVILIVTAVSLIMLIILFIFMYNTEGTPAPALPEWPKPSLNPLGKYWKAAVSADHQFCSEMGRDVMLNGGNAVDAVVPTAICIAVMNPHSAGIGGGHFMTYYDKKTGKCMAFDAREQAPVNAKETFFENKTKGASLTGWQSIAVPGNIHGLYTAYKQAGAKNADGITNKLTWKELLQPVIDLLEGDIPVSVLLVKHLWMKDNRKEIVKKDSTLGIFVNPNTKEPYLPGDVMKRPKLLETIKKLANSPDPIAEFYDGAMTDEMIKEIQNGDGTPETKGVLTKADFQAYETKIRKDEDMIYSDFKGGFRGCSLPPPSSGGTTLGLINVMSQFLEGAGQQPKTFEQKTLNFHRFIEAMKFAYAARSKFGDMSFVKDAFERATKVASSENAKEIAKQILSETTAQDFDHYGSDYEQKDEKGTSHISIVDTEGNAVALTSSINIDFGSKRMSKSTGIIWNCHMDDFSLPGTVNSYGFAPSKNNYIEGKKRPQSSMSPVVIFDPSDDNQVQLVLGAQGGSRIISTVAYVAMRTLWMNETVKQAIDAPRLHNQLKLDDETLYEAGFPLEYVDALRSKYKQNMKWSAPFSNCQGVQHRWAVMNKKNLWFACSDRRKSVMSGPAGW